MSARLWGRTNFRCRAWCFTCTGPSWRLCFPIIFAPCSIRAARSTSSWRNTNTTASRIAFLSRPTCLRGSPCSICVRRIFSTAQSCRNSCWFPIVIECPIPCNLCGGSDVEVIGDRDREGNSLRTTICRICGLVWSNPRPTPQEVRRYYSREYRLDYKGQSTPSLRHIARSARGALNRYRALAPYLKHGARILDAGAGGGEVVYVLRKLGFDASGLEPDEQYARHAREALDVPVATGFVQDATFPSCRFDVVTMYHALEHVEDPAAILSRLRSWMTDDGVLLIEVPNVEAVCISPTHRFHFAHFYNF